MNAVLSMNLKLNSASHKSFPFTFPEKLLGESILSTSMAIDMIVFSQGAFSNQSILGFKENIREIPRKKSESKEQRERENFLRGKRDIRVK